MLWVANKQTTHGLCECTGLIAPALGGGHGILQGKYGLMSDQFLALDVVLANGSLIRIDAERHQGLFWAMQGAGHNFGIVTSADYKIYDVPETEIGGRIWSHQTFIHEATEENLRKIYGAAKELLDRDEHPEGLKILGSIYRGPEPSRVPTIAHHVVWNGPLAAAPLWLSQDLDTTPPSRNPDLDDMAWSFGMRLRKNFIDGAKDNGGHQSYVNYAYGEETLEEID
ncbi:hypothetical protein N0V86_008546 [Didymella sp. IMI 355093]|nr:hypothetical protein N0V86_008546 [Didymella sp. IMI 355093]